MHTLIVLSVAHHTYILLQFLFLRAPSQVQLFQV
jgi:hypothetical protein